MNMILYEDLQAKGRHLITSGDQGETWTLKFRGQRLVRIRETSELQVISLKLQQHFVCTEYRCLP